MAAKTKIEWTEATWNPVTGCTKISPGCANCYAERMANRLRAMGQPKYRNGFKVTCHADDLDEPRRWQKPRTIFVCSMADLFHDNVPDEFIERVWDTMWMCPQHTFFVLTKRVERLVQWVRQYASTRHFGWTDVERTPFRCGGSMSVENARMRNECGYAGEDFTCEHPANIEGCDALTCPLGTLIDSKKELVDEFGYAEEDFTWARDDDGEEYAEDRDPDGWVRLCQRPRNAMAENVWLGFSAENQERYEYAAREFRSLRWHLGPYAKLFASLEPLLGPICMSMKYWPENDDADDDGSWSPLSTHEFQHGAENFQVPYLNWMIVGGESGHKARPCNVEWIRSVIGQCREAGVPCFVKQVGSHCVAPGKNPPENLVYPWITHPKGADPAEWPEDLRIQEFPT